VDIINVVSVTGKADVDHLLEEDDSEVQDNLYWRQALDVRTMELSVSTPTPKAPLSLSNSLFAVCLANLRLQKNCQPRRGPDRVHHGNMPKMDA
jgi:hypothetical protein